MRSCCSRTSFWLFHSLCWHCWTGVLPDRCAAINVYLWAPYSTRSACAMDTGRLPSAQPDCFAHTAASLSVLAYMLLLVLLGCGILVRLQVGGNLALLAHVPCSFAAPSFSQHQVYVSFKIRVWHDQAAGSFRPMSCSQLLQLTVLFGWCWL